MTTPDPAATLGAKLDALELTDPERDLLLAIVISAEPDDEVSGYQASSFSDLVPRLSFTYQKIEWTLKGSPPKTADPYQVSGSGSNT